MAKTRRGKGLLKTPGRGRGTCPVCKRTGVKLLYDQLVLDKASKVCKACQEQ